MKLYKPELFDSLLLSFQQHMHTEIFHTNDNDDNNKILVLIGTTCNKYESLPVIYSLAAAKCLNLSLHLRDWYCGTIE